MGRPRRDDRNAVADRIVAIRMTPIEEAMLDRLVEATNAKSPAGATANRSTLIRGLLAQVDGGDLSVNPQAQVPLFTEAQKPAPEQAPADFGRVARLAKAMAEATEEEAAMAEKLAHELRGRS